MDVVRELFRLRELGFGHRTIAETLRIARSTVQEYLRRGWELKLTYERAAAMDDAALKTLLGRRVPGRGRKPALREPDFNYIALELKRRKGVTLELLWREWTEDGGGGYSYSTYCRRYREWSRRKDVEYRHEYKAGEIGLADYTGETLSWWSEDGCEHKAEIFVAVLGASDLIFCEASPSQAILHWIGSNTRALEFFGGVPRAWIIDNLKSGVVLPDRYEASLTKTMQEWAAHYGTAVMPTRVKEPRDKGKVEQAVQMVERWILAPLRHRHFLSLAEINEAIKPLLTEVNQRWMQGYGASRKDLYEQGEREALLPLPVHTYTPAHWQLARVHMDYHVEIECRWYSVPYNLVKEEVWVKSTEKLVEVFHNNERVASHRRLLKPHQRSTCRAHMPPHHLAVSGWRAEFFIEWAKGVGPETHRFVAQLLESPQYQQQSYRSILGLQRLEKKYGTPRLEQAVATANKRKVLSQRFVRLLLQGESELLASSGNIRGADYYH